jgi:hypothetical protein
LILGGSGRFGGGGSAINHKIAKRLGATRQKHSGIDLPLTDTAIVVHFDRA